MIDIYINEPHLTLLDVLAKSAPSLIAVIALVTLIVNIGLNNRQRRYQRSEFCLRSALDAFQRAREKLEDGNNDRVSWIAAARAIQRGTRIAGEITEQVHRDVLDVEKDRFRLIFGAFLGFDDVRKSPNFFYGVTDTAMSLDNAAKKSSKRKDGRAQIANIPESTLHIIWKFSTFPKDYEDPIDTADRFPDSFLENMATAHMYPSLHEYLNHLRKYRSIGGTLVPLNKTSDSVKPT